MVSKKSLMYANLSNYHFSSLEGVSSNSINCVKNGISSMTLLRQIGHLSAHGTIFGAVMDIYFQSCADIKHSNCVYLFEFTIIFSNFLRKFWMFELVYSAIVVSILPIINKLKTSSESVTCFACLRGLGLYFITFWFGALLTEVPCFVVVHPLHYKFSFCVRIIIISN